MGGFLCVVLLYKSIFFALFHIFKFFPNLVNVSIVCAGRQRADGERKGDGMKGIFLGNECFMN